MGNDGKSPRPNLERFASSVLLWTVWRVWLGLQGEFRTMVARQKTTGHGTKIANGTARRPNGKSDGQVRPSAKPDDLTWDDSDHAVDNYMALGKVLAPSGDLYRGAGNASGLIMVSPGGNQISITKGAELLPVIVDRLRVGVIKNGKRKRGDPRGPSGAPCSGARRFSVGSASLTASRRFPCTWRTSP